MPAFGGRPRGPQAGRPGRRPRPPPRPWEAAREAPGPAAPAAGRRPHLRQRRSPGTCSGLRTGGRARSGTTARPSGSARTWLATRTRRLTIIMLTNRNDNFLGPTVDRIADVILATQ